MQSLNHADEAERSNIPETLSYDSNYSSYRIPLKPWFQPDDDDEDDHLHNTYIGFMSDGNSEFHIDDSKSFCSCMCP